MKNLIVRGSRNKEVVLGKKCGLVIICILSSGDGSGLSGRGSCWVLIMMISIDCFLLILSGNKQTVMAFVYDKRGQH